MKKRGLISQVEKGGPYMRNPAPDAEPPPKRVVRRKPYASRATAERPAKANGRAAPSAGVDLVKMREDLERKIEAIDVLLGDKS